MAHRAAKALAGGLIGGAAAALVTLLSLWAMVRLRPSGMQMMLGVGAVFVLATVVVAGLGTRRTGRALPTAIGVVAGEAILTAVLLVVDNRLSTFPSATTQGETLGYSLVLALTLIAVIGGAAALVGAIAGRASARR